MTTVYIYISVYVRPGLLIVSRSGVVFEASKIRSPDDGRKVPAFDVVEQREILTTGMYIDNGSA